MKCFIVSLHRTGTRSTIDFLSSFLSAIHYPGKHEGEEVSESKILGRETDLDFVADTLWPTFDAYDAVADVPTPVLYRQLCRRYPTAKFILLLRNPFDWVRSVRRHIGVRALRPFECVQYWQYLPWRPMRLSDEVDDRQLLRMNALHTAEIVEFFAHAAPANLGVFELGAEDTGRAIAAFLGVDSAAPLPHSDRAVS
jgi:Sulfotransferase domain